MRNSPRAPRFDALLPWVVATVEGFSTLAVEVIAIRLAVPVVGSSITLTGVMLGVVLFALSAGYWRGGALSARWSREQTRLGLTRNLAIAAIAYGALAFPLEARLLEKLLDTGFALPLAIGSMASLLFILPIYLASQTVPMLAELTDVDGKAGKASGKVLFFSTLGSVAGGIVTPVWLFPTLGVARSTWVVCGLLGAAACLMAAGYVRPSRLAGASVAGATVLLAVNMLAAERLDGFTFDSAYQTIRVAEEKGDDGKMHRLLVMGGGRASGVDAATGETTAKYVLAAERALAGTKAERVLAVGAAGFTFPRDVARAPFVNRIDAVDVDPVVKWIAEREFLRQTVPGKVRFLPLSARYAVRKLARDGERYGFTMLDAYCGKAIPDELSTVEFLRDVRAISTHTLVNMILDSTLESAFAHNMLATFREAFGDVWLQVLDTDSDISNVLITDWPAPDSTRWTGNGAVYRDDRNNADHDHVAMVWGSGE